MPPAFETAAARGAPDVLAMPARRIGYLMPSKVHSGVWSACGEDIMGDQKQSTLWRITERKRLEATDNTQRKTVEDRMGTLYRNMRHWRSVENLKLTAAILDKPRLRRMCIIDVPPQTHAGVLRE
jgi:hypothetical protein